MSPRRIGLAWLAVSTGCSSQVDVAHGPSGACGTLAIRQFQAPVVNGATCSVPRTPAGDPLSHGTLDVSQTDTYALRPLYEWSGSSPVTVSHLSVTIHEDSPDGPLVGPSFDLYESTRLAAGSAAAPSFEAAEYGVVPSQVGQALRSAVCRIDTAGVTPDCPVVSVTSVPRHLVVVVQAVGASDDGCAATTATSTFPIEVCCGCLLTFPADSDVPDSTVRSGPDCDNGTPALSAAVCAIGQDFPVDCRLCAHSNPAYCQPRGYSPVESLCPR